MCNMRSRSFAGTIRALVLFLWIFVCTKKGIFTIRAICTFCDCCYIQNESREDCAVVSALSCFIVIINDKTSERQWGKFE